tara:strand:+ start:260 stop:463 length:204 start_codon:yes stop_codon:yes gene_type:complete
MNDNDRIDLTLDKKDKSKVKHLMKMLDRTFKVGRKLDKNYTYRQTIEDSLSFFLSKEFNLKSRKELN